MERAIIARGIISVAPNEVFLSYASADRDRVAGLVHALEAEGMQVWWDRDIAYGESFHKVIEQALGAAACVIVVWTGNSVASEWVVNEASDARKRNRLVPVLLEPVTPPLEFRHLQTADLSRWKGDVSDAEFAGLRHAVSAMLVRSDPSQARAPLSVPARIPGQTRSMQLLGIGGLALGVSVLLLTLKYVGVIGSASPPSDKSLTPPTQSPSSTGGAQAPQSQGTSPTPPATGAPLAEPINLLDTGAGARLIAANEATWNRLFTGKPTFTIVSRNGFAVLAVAEDRPARFDTLGVFVDSTSGDNIKELAILTSSSAEGPFVKVAQVTVPNYRNMEKPLHELHFPPVEARFVKLQVVSLQNDYGPNGILGSIQLYASAK